MKKQPPCKPNCPKRSETCHGDCIEYAIFSAVNEVEREQRNKESEASSRVCEYHLDRFAKKLKFLKRIGKWGY